MKQSVTELVNVILERMEQYPDVPATEKGIRSWLTGQGYNPRDIDAALRLVQPQMGRPNISATHGPVPVRMLSAFEEHKLTTEARDALVRLELYELIDPTERELILDRISQFDGPVGMDELDYLLSWILYSTRDVETQQTIYSVFEGNRETLH